MMTNQEKSGRYSPLMQIMGQFGMSTDLLLQIHFLKLIQLMINQTY